MAFPRPVRAAAMFVVGAIVLGTVVAGLGRLTIQVEPIRINVRWEAGIDDAVRADVERELGLVAVEFREATTWNYEVADYSPDRLQAIVVHPAVDDTAGIVRSTFQPEAPPVGPWRRPAGAGVRAGMIGGALAAALWWWAPLGRLRTDRAAMPSWTLSVVLAGGPVALAGLAASLLAVAPAGWNPLWGDSGRRTMVRAAAAGDGAAVFRMLRAGGDPDATEVVGDLTVTPLEAAVVSGSLPTVQLLLNGGAMFDLGVRAHLRCLAVEVDADEIRRFFEIGGTAPECGDVVVPRF